ncbi:MAG: hypothetical protein R3324_11805 [Halobacteriales archaeon]|nr:hypothetical protein [Halobacteriales archaeon]
MKKKSTEQWLDEIASFGVIHDGDLVVTAAALKGEGGKGPTHVIVAAVITEGNEEGGKVKETAAFSVPAGKKAHALATAIVDASIKCQTE